MEEWVQRVLNPGWQGSGGQWGVIGYMFGRCVAIKRPSIQLVTPLDVLVITLYYDLHHSTDK